MATRGDMKAKESPTPDQFDEFNQMSNGEIMEDIDHRVRCNVPIIEACREVVEELGIVGQILQVETIRKAYGRWKKITPEMG